MYVHILKCPPPEEWATRNGVSGTVTIIWNKLESDSYTPNRRQIIGVLSSAYNAIIKGEEWTPESRQDREPVGCKIPDGSEYQMFVADL
jgi:hypothetical protein